MKYVPSMFFGNNLERVVRQAEPNLIFKGTASGFVPDIVTYPGIVSALRALKNPETSIGATYKKRNCTSVIK
jgi:hypothetical protein